MSHPIPRQERAIINPMQTGQPIRQQASRQIRTPNPPTRPPARPPVARRGMARMGVLGYIVLFLLMIAGVAAGVLYRSAEKVSNGKGAAALWKPLANPRSLFPERNRVNILLIGKDYDYDWTAKNPKLRGFRTSKNTRSDTIAMVSLDLANKKVSMLSVPRDTLVRAPETLGSDVMIEGKINGTYKRGGYPLLAATVGDLLGVKPDYYVAVKPDALKKIVDALGGVEVETVDRLVYNDWAARLFVDLPKGRQTINGEQAIGFARFREADIYKRNPDHSPIPVPGSRTEFLRKPRREIIHSREEGEPRRMARQQQLIRAMAAKAQQPQNLLRMDELINVGLDQVDTDLDRMQIFALVSLFHDIKSDRMESGTLKGYGKMSSSALGGRGFFFHVDEEKKQAMVDWLLRGDEPASRRLTVVEVRNGTDTVGVGNRFAERLRSEGYDVRSVGNADRGEGGHEVERTRIVFHTASVARRAEKVAVLLGGGTPVKEAWSEKSGPEVEEDPADITVVIGRDMATSVSSRTP
ncbi:MAG: LCP family protein [Capsulimonadales bacterium]|nr:LCP family protein [Capsulimonadales bacterium]